MRQVKDYNNGRDNKEKVKVLFMFDDCAESLKTFGKKQCVLNKLAMNHRHYNISHIMVSQSFKKLDPIIRNNTTGIILFNTDNTAERMKIIEELAGNVGRKKFEMLWYECVKDKYNFMFINYDNRKIYKNFLKIIGNLDQPPEWLYNSNSASKYRPIKDTQETTETPETNDSTTD